VVVEPFALELLVWRSGEASFQTLAVTLFQERISKRPLQRVAVVPISWKDAEAAQVSNLEAGQLFYQRPRRGSLRPSSSSQLGRHHLSGPRLSQDHKRNGGL